MKQRHLQPELMDDPALPRDEHRRALRGLARINLLSRAAHSLWVRAMAGAMRAGSQQAGRLSVLDIAAGSGDVLFGFCKYAERAGLVVDAHALDVSPEALVATREAAALAGRQVITHELSILGAAQGELGRLLEQRFDVVLCSLFLHHLREPQAVEVLRRAKHLAGGQVVVSDLCRGRAGLVAAHLAGNLLTRSPVVRVDAVRSMGGAFTVQELAALADEAGLKGHLLRRCWPFRMLLSWSAS